MTTQRPAHAAPSATESHDAPEHAGQPDARMTADFVSAAAVRPEVFVSRAGDHIQRGLQRGRELRTGIGAAIAGYQRYFAHLGITEVEARHAADDSYARLQAWAPEAAAEISAVAEGSGRTVTEIMEVIARTEIMTLAKAAPTECSTVTRVVPGATVSAQTWDWLADFSTLWHVGDVGAVPGQLRHVGIAEYGMLGKIGLNEAGVGVHLNILKHADDRAGGVPVHAVLDRVLSTAHTLTEAVEIIRSAPTSSSSVITVVTAEAAVQVEIAGEAKRELRPGDPVANGDVGAADTEAVLAEADVLLHTNHFLHPDLQAGAMELRADSSSRPRYDFLAARTAAAITAGDPPETTADLVALLTSGPGDPPVSCTPEPGAAYGDRPATLVTVQIDPGAKTIDLAPGSPADGLHGNRRFQL
ncbi:MULTISPECIES: C45 family autoproteolytic acyltransferase/hydolase [Brevibacterium]|uniref:C45 family autoproteolytic acyltransferase/hydolase n=1 Tax=Brevibacterium TaxID=1696 RepID=UPI0020120A18|nr:C45 family peptidase [Brevibacterium sp. W7.2]